MENKKELMTIDEADEIFGKMIRGEYGENTTDLIDDVRRIQNSFRDVSSNNFENSKKLAEYVVDNQKLKDKIADLVQSIPSPSQYSYEVNAKPVVTGSISETLNDLFND